MKIFNSTEARLIIFLLVFTFSFFIFVSVGYSPFTVLVPTTCQDSDGDCNFSRLNATDGIYEMVDLLTYPFGWVIATGLTDSIPPPNTIDAAYLHVKWFTDVDFGAENIYIDYWNGSSWHTCAGPFGESSTLTDTSCDISKLTKQQLNNIKVRFRGEDTDGFPIAFAYIDAVYIEVNHSSPPIFSNQSTNSTKNLIYSRESIQLSVQVFDDVGLDYAWLSTNETGVWRNYTDGTYGSPLYLNSSVNIWTFANFSWRNDSFLSGLVSWRIYANDTTGKENATEIQNFFVQFKKNPTSCQDSDGDCNFSRLNATDGIYEMVDLLTYPFGWVNVTTWDLKIPESTIINSAYLHVKWFTDVDFGAENIYIDYWNGSSWHTCAGPFGESSTLTDTSCDISKLTKQQLNNIKVRFRGEDTDGFPIAFAYIDAVYILVNYTVGVPYLEVYLVFPDTSKIANVVQNKNFLVNSTVYCRGGECGNVYGTLMYNLSSYFPDTPVNTSYGDKPFFIQETPSQSIKGCPSNPLGPDEFCNLTWVVNATGNITTVWKIGVYFNSSLNILEPNSTENATIVIVPCLIDLTLSWSSINFGQIIPNTYNNSAPGNANNDYNISVNPGSCRLNIYIRGNDLISIETGSIIKVGNVSWSNISSNINEGYFSLTDENALVKAEVEEGRNITTWYWLNVPPVYSGYYTGFMYIAGVESEKDI